MQTLQINGPHGLLVILALLASAISISSSIPLIKLLWPQDRVGHKGDLERERKSESQHQILDKNMVGGDFSEIHMFVAHKKKEEFFEIMKLMKYDEKMLTVALKQLVD